MTPEEILLENQPLISRLASRCCSRSGLTPQHAEDFQGIVNLKLCRDDYRVLREFQGRAKLSTYLTVVIQRSFQDYRNSLWGKWRPSAAAKKLGALAIRLEELTVRDGIATAQAIRMMVDNEQASATQPELEQLAEQLPCRIRRRIESDDQLEVRVDERQDTEARVANQESAALRETALRSLREALDELPAEDSLIAQLLGDHSVAQIARLLHLEQKPLYRRREKLLTSLRERLEHRGISGRMIEELLDTPGDHR